MVCGMLRLLSQWVTFCFYGLMGEIFKLMSTYGMVTGVVDLLKKLS